MTTTPKTTAWAVFKRRKILVHTVQETEWKSLNAFGIRLPSEVDEAKHQGYTCRKVTITVNKEKK